MTNNMRIYFIADQFSATGYNPRTVLRTVIKYTSLPSVVQSRILLEPQHALRALAQLAILQAVKTLQHTKKISGGLEKCAYV
jgi:hypothetical protein